MEEEEGSGRKRGLGRGNESGVKLKMNALSKIKEVLTMNCFNSMAPHGLKSDFGLCIKPKELCNIMTINISSVVRINSCLRTSILEGGKILSNELEGGNIAEIVEKTLARLIPFQTKNPNIQDDNNALITRFAPITPRNMFHSNFSLRENNSLLHHLQQLSKQ
ncbi:hypothetical protein RND71_012213 [Anisodus tanguticus]|uniref:Uncharacterized protein n=1 Tax=Anisodus tanguticus TaxID=243964 RepID=A0AAE1SGJ9_9SOLA|nr:hypothetical protein RND71_012213 [Anisodus tanguticus]